MDGRSDGVVLRGSARLGVTCRAQRVSAGRDELLGDATVVIDEKEAILEESGEVIHAIGSGAIAEDDLTELGAALSIGRLPTDGRTVFKSVGVAMQDWAIARLLAERCLAANQ